MIHYVARAADSRPYGRSCRFETARFHRCGLWSVFCRWGEAYGTRLARKGPAAGRIRMRPAFQHRLRAFRTPNSKLSYSSRFLYSAMESGQLSRKIARLTGIRVQPGSEIWEVGFTGFCPEPKMIAAAHTRPTST